jgi:4-alpha-glucanotransferase
MKLDPPIMPYLRMLARSLGIASSYIDYKKRRVDIEADVLCKLISDLSGENISVNTPVSQLRLLLRALGRKRTEAIIPSPIVAWDGVFPHVWIWAKEEVKEIICTVKAEEPNQDFFSEFRLDISDRAARSRSVDGQRYSRVRLHLNTVIPYGYYHLKIRTDAGDTGEGFLISAPRKLEPAPKVWGAFAPAYALRSEDDAGIGTYGDLFGAASLIKKHGGDFLGTLPLLPAFYEGDHFNISPYAPVSRLFWNEIFLDLSDLPGAGSGDIRNPVVSDLVDYSQIYAYKKKHLLQAAEAFFAKHPDGDEGFQNFVREKHYLKEYAEFRARECEGCEFEETRRFHMYVQYVCHLQILKIKTGAEEGSCAWIYLDYTVGVHTAGFDAGRMASLFMKGYQVGAPPDALFGKGQNWGFEPLHPRKLEKNRFAYLRESLHHYLQYAKIIRLDHIMGFYRLYCIPDGMEPYQGTYVYYSLEGHLGVLCLEAWRHDAILVGEDLGTVPEMVCEAMEDHAINRIWVGQFNIGSHLKKSFSSIRPAMLACLNTHDMAPFQSYLQGLDLDRLRDFGFLSEKEFRNLKKERDKNISGLLKSSSPFLTALEGIAKSRAHLVMINLEDLWAEKNAQNMPGTVNEHLNWQRRFTYTLKELEALPIFKEATDILNEYRAGRL